MHNLTGPEISLHLVLSVFIDLRWPSAQWNRGCAAISDRTEMIYGTLHHVITHHSNTFPEWGIAARGLKILDALT